MFFIIFLHYYFTNKFYCIDIFFRVKMTSLFNHEIIFQITYKYYMWYNNI